VLVSTPNDIQFSRSPQPSHTKVGLHYLMIRQSEGVFVKLNIAAGVSVDGGSGLDHQQLVRPPAFQGPFRKF